MLAGDESPFLIVGEAIGVTARLPKDLNAFPWRPFLDLVGGDVAEEEVVPSVVPDGPLSEF